jgi:hypothetical protein
MTVIGTGIRRSQLDAHAFQALIAGRYAAIRDHWLSKAREAQKEQNTELCQLFVDFAKSAHRAYCQDLGRALKYQRRTRSMSPCP